PRLRLVVAEPARVGEVLARVAEPAAQPGRVLAGLAERGRLLLGATLGPFEPLGEVADARDEAIHLELDLVPLDLVVRQLLGERGDLRPRGVQGQAQVARGLARRLGLLLARPAGAGR